MSFEGQVPETWPKVNITPNARVVLEKRYLKQENGKVIETPEDMIYRVASVVAEIEKDKYGKGTEEIQTLTSEFYTMMANLEFMPNSPTLMNAGRDLGQLSACFVLPVEDSMEEIFDAIKNAAIIHKSGGGTGFSFSRLRPKNSMVRSTGGVASGPVSFMKVFNSATEAVKQGGTRRGANMGILRVDHPDILEFIQCKEDNKEITNFNISVGITEEFMLAVREDRPYDLVDPHTGKAVGQLSATEIFNKIVDHAWQNGEPGIVFLDRLNQGNPTPLLGEIEATNPCGEQPLLPNEACNLGSINLKLMVTEKKGKMVIDWERLSRVTRSAVHFLDNVIDANLYPLPIIDEVVKGNRKIGLGVMGFADMLILLQTSYATEEAVEYAEKVMKFIQTEARIESQRLAEERGTFPNYEGSVYDGVMKLRNATLTTIAPTGTISMICSASSGVEPLFAVAYTKTVMDGTALVEVNPLFEAFAKEYGFYSPELMQKIADQGTVLGLSEVPNWVQEVFVTAQEIAPEWHIRIQAAFQKYTDNAVSKTINFANSATHEEIAEAYRLADELQCKGLTVYRDGSREEQVLSTGTQGAQSQEVKPEEESSMSVPSKPFVPEVNTIIPRPRPTTTIGVTEKIKIGCGNLYVSVNADEKGICEVFTNTGRAGGCSSQSEATARLISISLRSGLSVDAITEQIKGIRCPACMRREGVNVTSCPDAIARVIKKYNDVGINFTDIKVSSEGPALKAEKAKEISGQRNAAIEKPPVKKTHANVAPDNACPECGMSINHESGCVVCTHCGYSKCG
ncbi:ribonucleoside-diphosphate reductase, adenosylcobalamin-dependent [Desulfosporosinus orientis DSM 765]|uniref:Vitamin B12-dependent ribonucleotide reductase n=1 Tax=Desulfosporosinus orientis (strain ATCC 19365 / DSM 765 / NCIMB 8382 / VKM B-1628 / Singapore I) TaxID=768706 RepID=G7W7H6_DESOD|nr:vitamin B12-dependent ribonucleotide reductase [Desulfosporosinus orientis]AET65895.1 ribonucleoside-diphosphate reductase, adenosylcobalamin-dependent [Desulfosporosinus orientis DSM 765]